MPELIQLIYASAATAPFSHDELRALLEKSRSYNSAHQLSGLLLYHESSFLQVLEGPANEVEKLEARIRLDTRHHHYLQMVRRPIETREFPDWSMAFRDVGLRPEDLPEGFSEFLQKGNDESVFANAGRARTLLLAFKKVCAL